MENIEIKNRDTKKIFKELKSSFFVFFLIFFIPIFLTITEINNDKLYVTMSKSKDLFIVETKPFIPIYTFKNNIFKTKLSNVLSAEKKDKVTFARGRAMHSYPMMVFLNGNIGIDFPDNKDLFYSEEDGKYYYSMFYFNLNPARANFYIDKINSYLEGNDTKDIKLLPSPKFHYSFDAIMVAIFLPYFLFLLLEMAFSFVPTKTVITMNDELEVINLFGSKESKFSIKYDEIAFISRKNYFNLFGYLYIMNNNGQKMKISNIFFDKSNIRQCFEEIKLDFKKNKVGTQNFLQIYYGQ